VTPGTYPVAEPPFPAADTTPVVDGVVLAAGQSKRFGAQNKLLAPVEGIPLVCHAVAPVCTVLSRVVVVVGNDADAVRDALADYPVECVENPDYADGQATSLACGVEQIRFSADGALFALGDMPAVDAATVELLCEAFAAGVGDPLVAAHNGHRGNPVLFGPQYFDQLATQTGDTGGRPVLQSAPGTTLVETGDRGVRRDVDHPSDLPGNSS
jgi:molybdenum cofactor cytidylyltransferase